MARSKKMTKEAAAEKAKLIKEKIGTGTHRMTRKKRRAREEREAFQSSRSDDEDNGMEQQRLPSIKKAARDHKREASERERMKLSKSIHDEHIERAAKKRKTKTGADSVGDGSLFRDERVAYSSKDTTDGADSKMKSSYKFVGYEPGRDDIRKGKKKSHHKFKSKSKYKRR